MKVINGLKGMIKYGVVTIGVFDGVHIGHKKIIREVVKRAKVLKAKSIVLTFDPHPSKILNSRMYIPRLASLKHRIKLIGQLGVDYLVVIKFTRPVLNMPPEKFVKSILIRRLGLKEIYVGENFYFGKGAGAGVNALKKMARDFGFKIKIFKPIKREGHIVSSSLIRQLIVNGDIVKASRLLGRPVSILGTVVRGNKRGRILGFPTANINPHHEAIPPDGVYAIRIRFKDKLFRGILNIGVRPTFCKNSKACEPTIEVHIFNFNKKLYGEDLEVIFVKKMRNEKRFADRDSLVCQIKRDAEKARAFLG